MIGEWMAYSLTAAALVIGFMGGTRVGRLQERDYQRRLRQQAALRIACPTCGASPGQSCIPTRHRVPSQRRGAH